MKLDSKQLKLCVSTLQSKIESLQEKLLPITSRGESDSTQAKEIREHVFECAVLRNKISDHLLKRDG